MTNNYRPEPLKTEHVVLNDEILELVEMLAENAHDLWAYQRMSDGWVFGPERRDTLRQHPCLVPYAHLPESEKEYDRKVVLGTIRAILALGFVVSKS
jgi:ryanodine receptor 2